MDKIEAFIGDYRFLSNFFIEPDGTSVEVEFQREKCVTPSDKQRFEGLTPSKAKALGRNVGIRPDWESVKLGVMEYLVRQKFSDHPILRDKLLATGSAVLQEGNWWNDRFWGICNGKGENHLGIILMDIRSGVAEHAMTISQRSGESRERGR